MTDGHADGIGVGDPATYDGDIVGCTIGDDDGDDDGSGVGLPGTYDGDMDGQELGD